MNQFARFTLPILLAAIIYLPHMPSYAALFNDDGSLAETPAGTGTSGGGQCDFTEYKEGVAALESDCCGGYEASAGSASSACGKYQFLSGTAATLESFQNAPANCKNMCTKGVGFASQGCASTQEAMMDEFSLENLTWLKNKCPAAQASVGRQVQGYDGRSGGKGNVSCTLTWSAILAGAHYQGRDGICTILGSGQDRIVGNNHISAHAYMCEVTSKQVPGTDCTPQAYPTSSGGTTVAQNNWETATSSAGGSQYLTPAAQLNSLSDTLKYVWVGAFQLMTEQLTAAMIQQVQGIGMLLDAKHQLETQRLFQQKTAEAHKDYHPSVQMCEIGTFVRNLADTEGRAKLTKAAMAKRLLERELMSGDSSTVKGDESDIQGRILTYREKFCNLTDNAKSVDTLCQDNNTDPERKNRDIDYVQTLEAPLTLDIDLLDNEVTADEENLFSLLGNLFMHRPLPTMPEQMTTLRTFVEPYERLRSLVAMRSIARNSVANIVAQKTAGPSEGNNAGPFLKAMMVELGLTPEEAELIVGENPSYFAQMEILSKKIYQDPEFIINLYDKPTNVKRVSAAMRAIKLMQDRDIQEALHRREMLLSIILELKIRGYQDDIYDAARSGMRTRPPTK